MTNAEVLDALVGAWRAGDARGAAAFFADAARYVEAGRAAVVGRAAIEAHFARFFGGGTAFRFDVDEIVEAGDRCAVAYRFATRDPVDRWHEQEGCALVTFLNGTILRWREYKG